MASVPPYLRHRVVGYVCYWGLSGWLRRFKLRGVRLSGIYGGLVPLNDLCGLRLKGFVVYLNPKPLNLGFWHSGL